jgi:XRE family transcriptional regulator, aerobic/anaerobic benzoate catabolism transcriptional regulator
LIGDRVRELRAQRGMTRRALAHHSGVSERYLAQLESGAGNPTITVIRSLARAFGVAPDVLVVDGRAQGGPEARNRQIALIGLRGAGKTTLGGLLARRLGVRFIELDREVERDAGVRLSEIFEFYGQAGFRRFERNALERIVESENAFVLAAGGSIVSEPLTFERLLATCFTVWLTATPAEHMERVVAQGDMRPMAGHPKAMDELRRILLGREALYGRAHATISTSHRSVDDVLAELLSTVMRPSEIARTPRRRTIAARGRSR